MSAFALIAGKLTGEPVTRDTRNGGRVTFFRLRVANGATLEWWDVATFSDSAREELDGATEGAPLSAVGEFRVEPWEKGDRRGFNYKLTADRILALKPKRKEAKPSASKPERNSRVAAAGAPASSGWSDRGDVNDDIPF
jgi:single-stranded DNA-binding protein